CRAETRWRRRWLRGRRRARGWWPTLTPARAGCGRGSPWPWSRSSSPGCWSAAGSAGWCWWGRPGGWGGAGRRRVAARTRRGARAALAHDEPAADSAGRYLNNFDFFNFLKENNPEPGVWDGRWRGLEDARPPAMLFFFRTARTQLAPTNYHIMRETPGVIDQINPPPLEPGMADA